MTSHCDACGTVTPTDAWSLHWDHAGGVTVTAESCSPPCRAAVEAHRDPDGVLSPPPWPL